MAHIDDGGEERSTQVDLNIVPFIDLMSVLIIFLLITAVWSQISMIQIGSSIYGQKTDDLNTPPPPQVEIPFRLDIKPSGYQIVIGRQRLQIRKVSGEYNKPRLLKQLKVIKAKYPEKLDAIISVADDLEYVTLIDGMDALLSSGFSQIAISPSELQ